MAEELVGGAERVDRLLREAAAREADDVDAVLIFMGTNDYQRNRPLGRWYDETPGDAGRALVAISDTYIDDGGRAHIVSNGAENVTLAGLDFTFGAQAIQYDSLKPCYWQVLRYQCETNND